MIIFFIDITFKIIIIIKIYKINIHHYWFKESIKVFYTMATYSIYIILKFKQRNLAEWIKCISVIDFFVLLSYSYVQKKNATKTYYRERCFFKVK